MVVQSVISRSTKCCYDFNLTKYFTFLMLKMSDLSVRLAKGDCYIFNDRCKLRHCTHPIIHERMSTPINEEVTNERSCIDSYDESNNSWPPRVAMLIKLFPHQCPSFKESTLLSENTCKYDVKNKCEIRTVRVHTVRTVTQNLVKESLNR